MNDGCLIHENLINCWKEINYIQVKSEILFYIFLGKTLQSWIRFLKNKSINHLQDAGTFGLMIHFPPKNFRNLVTFQDLSIFLNITFLFNERKTFVWRPYFTKISGLLNHGPRITVKLFYNSFKQISRKQIKLSL